MASAEATTNGVEDQPTSSTSAPTENATAANASPKKDDNVKLALNYLIQGKRHLVVKDFLSAIESLGESCRLMAESEPGETKPVSYDNAEAHFFYGKALLEQSRIELGVLEGADLPKSEADSMDESEDEEKDDDEEDEEEGEEEAPATNGTVEAESSEATANGSATEEEKTKASSSDSKAQESAVTSSDETGKAEENEVDLNVPSPTAAGSSSAGLVVDNEMPSTSSGLTAEAAAEKQAEEELSNLELAWEVLEVAKLGFRKLLNDMEGQSLASNDKTEKEKLEFAEKEKALRKRLADTHCSLGEVATESENYNQAIEEFKTGLEILNEIEGSDSREIAQYHFQMGLAYSFDKNFPDALASFRKSVEIIEHRISTLKHKIETKQTAKDLGVPLEDGSKSEVDEVQELTALLPELQEKITDTIDAEKENQREQEETKKEDEIIARNSPIKNPNPPAANDISHLVKKKKKADDAPSDERPVKKLCTELLSEPAPTTTPMETSTEAVPAEATKPPATNGHSISIDA